MSGEMNLEVQFEASDLGVGFEGSRGSAAAGNGVFATMDMATRDASGHSCSGLLRRDRNCWKLRVNSVRQSTAVDGASLSGKERERFAAELFDKISPRYDIINRLISWNSDRRWRRLAIEMAKIPAGGSVADLGTGTGDLYILARQAVGEAGHVLGLDISANMLAGARRRIERELPRETADLRQASAEKTGLADESIDVALMGWSLRNVGDRPAAYAEILRVLKPGGRLVAIDMSHPAFAPFRWGNSLYLRYVMPNVATLVGGDRQSYVYLARSTHLFPGAAALAEEWREAGFQQVAHRGLMLGSIAIHVGVK